MLHLDRRILSELRIIAIVYWAFQEDEAFEVTCDIVYGGSNLSKMDRGDEFQLRKPVAHRQVPVLPVSVWSRRKLLSKLSQLVLHKLTSVGV